MSISCPSKNILVTAFVFHLTTPPPPQDNALSWPQPDSTSANLTQLQVNLTRSDKVIGWKPSTQTSGKLKKKLSNSIPKNNPNQPNLAVT